jgi:hypothetical protein
MRSVLVAAVVFLTLGGSAAAQCPNSASNPNLTPPDPSPAFAIPSAIASRWKQNEFGAALTPARPILSTGGTYQEFRCGQIIVLPGWARDMTPTFAGPFVLSARALWIFNAQGQAITAGKPGEAVIEIEWGDTSPFVYDHFLVRWDEDDSEPHLADQHKNDAQQVEVGSGTKGITRITVGTRRTFRIYVEGCRDGKGCPQGWSDPVWIDVEPLVLPDAMPAPPPAQLQPDELNAHEPKDGQHLTPGNQRAIREWYCPGGLLGDDGQLNGGTALMRLQIVRDEPSNYMACGKSMAELRKEVNDGIRQAIVASKPGTDVDGLLRWLIGFVPPLLLGAIIGAAAFNLLFAVGSKIFPLIGAVIGTVIGAIIGVGNVDKPGDYDMNLTTLMKIAYRHEKELFPETRCHMLRKLLVLKGGAKNFFDNEANVHISGILTPIRETENHVLMIQSARHLSNNLYVRWAADIANTCPDVTVPTDVNNDANGMTDWWLENLHLLLRHDFYEFSSRVYADHALGAIENLVEFAAIPSVGTCFHSKGDPPVAKGCDVRRAARNIMDFVVAKFALSSNGMRRAAPFRRHVDNRIYTRLFGKQHDIGTSRFLGYTGGSPQWREQRMKRLVSFDQDRAGLVQASDYAPPYLVSDLMSDLSQKPYGLGAGGTVRWLQRFRGSNRHRSTPEIYYRENKFLISGGGVFDQGAGLEGGETVNELFSGGENAWPMPTSLMPTAEGIDMRDFIRIQGSWTQKGRTNLCVTHGFACGLNPIIAKGIPAACIQVEGEWTFVDMDGKRPGCPLKYGFVVAVLRRVCVPWCIGNSPPETGDDARDAPFQPTAYSFGLFEALSDYRTFDSFVADVLAKNPATNFVWGGEAAYNSPSGRTIKFTFTSDKDTYPIIGVDGSGPPLTIERDTRKWPLAAGDVINSPIPACVTIDNERIGQRLILDNSVAKSPARARVYLPSRCGCPVTPQCQPMRLE